MATNYDASDPPFTSKSEMLNYEFSSSCKPSESIMHMIECDPHQSVLTEMYTRAGELTPNKDIKFYDLGKFQIATTGFQGTSVNIGELHCTYQIRLLKPKLFSTLGEDIAVFQSRNNNFSNALPLGIDVSTAKKYSQNNLNVNFINGNNWNLPISNVAETFLVSYNWVGSSATAWVGPPLQTAANASLIEYTGLICPTVGTTTQGAGYQFIVKTKGGSTLPVISLSGDKVLPGAPTDFFMKVWQIPNSVTTLVESL